MDVLDTYHVTQEALRIAREERRPVLVEAITYRFRGHSMADPEEYRTKEQVAEWRKRDPILQFGDRLEAESVVTADEREQIDAGRDRARRRGGRLRRRSRRCPPPSRSTTTSTSSAARSAAGTRSTSARPACTAARTSASSPSSTARPTATAATSETGDVPQQMTAAVEAGEDT